MRLLLTFTRPPSCPLFFHGSTVGFSDSNTSREHLFINSFCNLTNVAFRHQQPIFLTVYKHFSCNYTTVAALLLQHHHSSRSLFFCCCCLLCSTPASSGIGIEKVRSLATWLLLGWWLMLCYRVVDSGKEIKKCREILFHYFQSRRPGT